jgi:BirA family transcriptional regulator, biotin operon repressor / biotin---[acetyl-CoA-carboxylase] ligase
MPVLSVQRPTRPSHVTHALGGCRMKHVHFESIDSTNDEAQRLAARGASEPILITAAEQTAGRGRSGRTWQSPRGGAWMSVLWPIHRAVDHYAATPLVAGLSVLRAVRRIIEKYQSVHVPLVQIKWPNDVLLDDRKVAGILCETACTMSRISHLIIGVGINVDFHSKVLKGNLRHTPTTLRESLKLKLPVDVVVDAFVTQFEILMNRYDDQGLSPGMLRELRANLAYVGQTKRWGFADETFDAEIAGLDPSGRLLLRAGGTERVVDYGEINAPEAEVANT